MDLKLFLLVCICCVLCASAQDMRDKAMQAAQSGQLRRMHSRFGRNFVMPPVDEEEKQLNEILNEIPVPAEGELGEFDGGLEPGMADGKWHLPLGNRLLKYLWSQKKRDS